MIMYNTHLTRHTLCGLSFIALTLYKISAASLSTQMPQLLEECLPPPQLPHERAFFYSSYLLPVLFRQHSCSLPISAMELPVG